MRLLLFLALAGPAVLAQDAPERGQAIIHRFSPAVAPFSESIAARLIVAPGHAVNLFASGLEHPRMLETGADGTVYVTRRDRGDVIALRDNDGDGRADERRTFATGLAGVHGIARRGDELLLASSTTVWRTPAGAAAPQPMINGLPDGGQHPNRMVRVAPDGTLYVSVGSSCNDCAEENLLERATMIRYSADGRERSVVANGLRNTIGYDWHPVTGALWGADNGTDHRGDRIPPEELNRIEAGRNYGWPVCFADSRVDDMTNAPPERLALAPGQARPDEEPLDRAAWCARTAPATLLLPAHSAPMALRFSPEGDAFLALRGSWNRRDPAGYRVVRIRFSADGQPLQVQDFLSGFADRDSGLVHGRPVGLAFAADGSLLVSDDTNGAIYRVARSAMPRR